MWSLDYLKTGSDTVWSTFLVRQCDVMEALASRMKAVGRAGIGIERLGIGIERLGIWSRGQVNRVKSCK